MHFLVDDNNKIIIGWSPKCGCSHIKNIFWFLRDNERKKKHILTILINYPVILKNIQL